MMAIHDDRITIRPYEVSQFPGLAQRECKESWNL